METNPAHNLLSLRSLLLGPGAKTITIPRIQRSYAQGRADDHASRTRRRFLKALRQGVERGGIHLDFIYGSSQAGSGDFVPLDGQQRLTTLWLLHWYAGRRSRVADDESAFLEKFTYQTRPSARMFCQELIRFTPDLTAGKSPSEQIKDQPWFPLEWAKEATIASMLVMLDAIDQEFRQVDGLWEKLDTVKFHFCDLPGLGLTDEVYIKMNSRGKPLTPFEHFKAELHRAATQAMGEDWSNRLMAKIDGPWTDLLWPYATDHVVDSAFMRFFHFLFDMMRYRSDNPSAETDDHFRMVHDHLSDHNPQAKDNFRLIEDYFDSWCAVSDVPALFSRFVAEKNSAHEPGKVPMWWNGSQTRTNLLELCFRDYADIVSRNRRRFSLPQIIVLEAFSTLVRNHGEITGHQFHTRLRMVNNLVANSDIREELMPNILAQTRHIILTGEPDTTLADNFNSFQLQEELDKLELLRRHPEAAEPLCRLEDHPLLIGKTVAVGWDKSELWQRFDRLWQCDWDSVDRALMSVADGHWQRDRYWRIQSGTRDTTNTEPWRNLLRANKPQQDVERTRRALRTVLELDADLTDQILDVQAERFLEQCRAQGRYPWRYYYVAYPEFRPGRNGKYTRYGDREYGTVCIHASGYESSNAYDPFLKAIAGESAHWNHDDRTRKYLILPDGTRVTSSEQGFVQLGRDQDGAEQELSRLDIPQDADGIDTEDRIVRGRQWLQGL